MSPPLLNALKTLVSVLASALSEYVLGKVDSLNKDEQPKH